MPTRLLFFLFFFVFVSCSPVPRFLDRIPASVDSVREFTEIVLPLWENLLGRDTLEILDQIIETQSHMALNKTTVMIPMSDGVELKTIITLPADYQPGQKFSAVLDRTPYDAEVYQFLIDSLFLPRGYVSVVQDLRGKYGSGGEWEFWRKSASDGFDTINWLTEQSWSDGNIMAFGISADGIAATCQEAHRPPPSGLKAQSLWVATGDGYTSAYNNGAYRESLISGWLESNGEISYIPTIQAHEKYGPWWYPIDLSIQWNNTNVPAVHAGGWYDIFSDGTIQSFYGYQYKGGEGAKGNQYLMLNPLGHCGGGEYRFPRARNLWMLKITYDMFNQARSSDLYVPQSLPICFYVMGPDPATTVRSDPGNFWACMEDFPTPTDTLYYFHADGSLSTSPANTQSQSSSFVYDPTYPVPTLGGNNLLLPTCGPYDQTALEQRNDVLTFTSDILSSTIAITGDVKARLFVSSSANDTDFTVKLTDVYDGKSYNILDNIIRMRWRDSRTQISLMEPGFIYDVTFSLSSTSYVFLQGHQIRVDISSSNYPRFSANLNNGRDLQEKGDPVVATNTLHHDIVHRSSISLPIVPLEVLESAATSPFEPEDLLFQ